MKPTRKPLQTPPAPVSSPATNQDTGSKAAPLPPTTGQNTGTPTVDGSAATKSARRIRHQADLVGDEKDPVIKRLRRWLDQHYEFRLDIVGNEIEYRPKLAGTAGFTPMNENTLKVQLYEYGFTRFEQQLMALMQSDYIPPFDPIKTYFEGLSPWDTTKPDYIAQLAGYVKARNQDWFVSQYRKWLVRAVACAIGVIPFNKQLLLFVGQQNDGKSSFIRFHQPAALEAYYTEHIDLATGNAKDGKIALCENFLINLDELASFAKADINRCKSMLTEEKVKVRRPFAKKPTLGRRRASFMGSTNQTNFLTDETGNVRWLVMEILHIQHDNGGGKGYARNIDIDHVWSQAYALLQSGFAFQMTRQEIEQSERHNQHHMQTSLEREFIAKHFKPSEPKEENAEFWTAGEVMQWLLKRYEYKIRLNSVSIGRALTSMGFSMKSSRREGCTYPIQAYWLHIYQ